MSAVSAIDRIHSTRVQRDDGMVIIARADYATLYAMALRGGGMSPLPRASTEDAIHNGAIDKAIGVVRESQFQDAEKLAFRIHALKEGEGIAPNHRPSYYDAPNGIRFEDVVNGFGLGPWAAFVVKYVIRAGKKGPALADLNKARECLEIEIARCARESEAAR